MDLKIASIALACDATLLTRLLALHERMVAPRLKPFYRDDP
jgi:hypothetical protein